MHYNKNCVYHIYNRGNNHNRIFFSDPNYIFFLKKIKILIKPVCDILSWTLMPNHFHLIIHTNEKSCKERKSFGGKPMQELAYRIGVLLSSYCQAINRQNGTSGSLFQQKTKSKMLESPEAIISCMHYLHQNPWKAGLVKKFEQWEYSSFLDFAKMREGSLCDIELFVKLTGYDLNNFYQNSYDQIDLTAQRSGR